MGQRGSRTVGGALALASLMAASPSLAAPQSSRLEYLRGPGAESCPDASRLSAIIAARLGYDPFDAHAKRLVTVTLKREDKRLLAHVESYDASGKVTGARDLDSSGTDCDELASAVALTVSIAIDPVSAMQAVPPKPVDPPKPVEPPKPADPPKPEETSKLAPPLNTAPAEDVKGGLTSRSPLRFFFGGGFGVTFGVAPAPAAGFRAQVGLLRGALSLAIEGEADLKASRDVLPTGGVETSLLRAAALPCGRWKVLFGCALIAVGSIDATAKDIATPKRAQAVFAQAGARAGVEFDLFANLSAHAEADLLAALTPTALSVDGLEVWRTSSLGGALGAGLVGRLP